MEMNQRHRLVERAMVSFSNGQLYESFYYVAQLVNMEGKLSSHERHLMCDVFLGIVNIAIIDEYRLRMRLESNIFALQQMCVPTEEQIMAVQEDMASMHALLWHLSTIVHQMVGVTLTAQRAFLSTDYEPNVLFMRILGECLGIMGHLVNPNDEIVQIAASTAFTFGVMYGFHLPPTDPTVLENIISYCTFSIRNLYNIDAAIELAIHAKTSCTEQMIRESSQEQITRHRLNILDNCLEAWIFIRNIRDSQLNQQTAPCNINHYPM